MSKSAKMTTISVPDALRQDLQEMKRYPSEPYYAVIMRELEGDK